MLCVCIGCSGWGNFMLGLVFCSNLKFKNILIDIMSLFKKILYSTRKIFKVFICFFEINA